MLSRHLALSPLVFSFHCICCFINQDLLHCRQCRDQRGCQRVSTLYPVSQEDESLCECVCVSEWEREECCLDFLKFCQCDSPLWQIRGLIMVWVSREVNARTLRDPCCVWPAGVLHHPTWQPVPPPQGELRLPGSLSAPLYVWNWYMRRCFASSHSRDRAEPCVCMKWVLTPQPFCVSYFVRLIGSFKIHTTQLRRVVLISRLFRWRGLQPEQITAAFNKTKPILYSLYVCMNVSSSSRPLVTLWIVSASSQA